MKIIITSSKGDEYVQKRKHLDTDVNNSVLEGEITSDNSNLNCRSFRTGDSVSVPSTDKVVSSTASDVPKTQNSNDVSKNIKSEAEALKNEKNEKMEAEAKLKKENADADRSIKIASFDHNQRIAQLKVKKDKQGKAIILMMIVIVIVAVVAMKAITDKAKRKMLHLPLAYADFPIDQFTILVKATDPRIGEITSVINAQCAENVNKWNADYPIWRDNLFKIHEDSERLANGILSTMGFVSTVAESNLDGLESTCVPADVKCLELANDILPENAVLAEECAILLRDKIVQLDCILKSEKPICYINGN